MIKPQPKTILSWPGPACAPLSVQTINISVAENTFFLTVWCTAYGSISLFLRSSMRFPLRLLLLAGVFLSLFSACSTYDKVRKSSDINYKLSKANEYYDKKH